MTILLINTLGIIFLGSLLLWCKNLLYALLYFGLLIIFCTGYALYFGYYFFAIVQLILYTGGMLVFLLSIAMLVGVYPEKQLVKNYPNPIVIVIACSLLIFAVKICQSVCFDDHPFKENTTKIIEKIGFLFCHQYFILFEIMAFMLLLAMIGLVYMYQATTNNKV